MNLSEEAKRVFDVILGKTPAAMRPMMKAKTEKRAIKFSESRGASSIELDDLVQACIHIVPAFAHKNLRRDFEELGLQPSQYEKFFPEA